MVQRMNSEEMITITIPYDDYLDLMDLKYAYLNLERELLYIIEDSELSYSKDELSMNDITMRRLLKKYYRKDYNNKIEKLKKESESEK